MSDRVVVMNRGRDRADRQPERGLQPAAHALRRRLRRRVERSQRHRRATARRPLLPREDSQRRRRRRGRGRAGAERRRRRGGPAAAGGRASAARRPRPAGRHGPDPRIVVLRPPGHLHADAPRRGRPAGDVQARPPHRPAAAWRDRDRLAWDASEVWLLPAERDAGQPKPEAAPEAEADPPLAAVPDAETTITDR